MKIEFYIVATGKVLQGTNDWYFVMNDEVYSDNGRHCESQCSVVGFDDLSDVVRTSGGASRNNNMKFILLAILTNTYMGDFESQAACQRAIRSMYEVKLAMQSTDKVIGRKVVDTVVASQRESLCVPKQ